MNHLRLHKRIGPAIVGLPRRPGPFVTMLVVVALGRTFPLWAAEGELPFSRLKLTIRTDQATYVLGQPIAVYPELANPNDKPVVGRISFGWYARGGTYLRARDVPDLVIECSSSGHPFAPYTPYRTRGGYDVPPAKTEIRPGGKRVAKVLLVFGHPKADWLLHAGTLDIRGSATAWETAEPKVLSAPVRITVKQPSGADSAAYSWLRERDLLVYLGHIYWRRSKDADVVALKAFLEKYPETIYAGYVQFGLGQMNFHDKRYDEAVRVFEDVAKRFPKCTIAEEANYLVGECYFQQGKLIDAARRFEQVLNRYPGTPVAEDADERLTRLADYWEMLFPDDKRLDVKVDLDFLQPTPLAQVLKVLSVRSGVALRAAPEFDDRTHRSAFPAQLPLRRFMSGLRLYITEQGRVQAGAWLREDDGGYRLVPVVRPDWEKQYKLPPKNPEPKRGKPPAGKPAVPGDAKAQPR